MTGLVVVTSMLVTCVVVGWFFVARRHPENAADHRDPDTLTRSDRFSRGSDAPADPGAEVMDPDLLGGDNSPPRGH